MSDTKEFEQRLIEENKELNVKIDKLSLFLGSYQFKELDTYQQNLLKSQLDYMFGYSGILERRIKLINKK